jgi:anthranilate synthase component 2
MFLLIDNYDSFTYNLYHYLLEIGAQVDVHRNDTLTVSDIQKRGYEGIIISPGPCSPSEAGICVDLIKALYSSVPILGVCLGHQSIGQALGGKVIRGDKPMHAKISTIHHLSNSRLFDGIPTEFKATRYHSLIVEKSSVPKSLKITAQSDDGVIQALEHVTYPVFGLQFHPESITSEHGHHLLKNFITIAQGKK